MPDSTSTHGDIPLSGICGAQLMEVFSAEHLRQLNNLVAYKTQNTQPVVDRINDIYEGKHMQALAAMSGGMLYLAN